MFIKTVLGKTNIQQVHMLTSSVLVFATERKNNVYPRLRFQKVNYVHLPSNWCTTDVSNIYE